IEVCQTRTSRFALCALFLVFCTWYLDFYVCACNLSEQSTKYKTQSTKVQFPVQLLSFSNIIPSAFRHISTRPGEM
ncbi:MAG TPA: hypothetical protein VLB68_16000, partial [Pyrinomonadaceae bacterium]|nr:hypothetical protein [Pyrinomonadaceae bacterium]